MNNHHANKHTKPFIKEIFIFLKFHKTLEYFSNINNAFIPKQIYWNNH